MVVKCLSSDGTFEKALLSSKISLKRQASPSFCRLLVCFVLVKALQ